MTRTPVLLVSHGTVDDLDDLGPFVTNVRHGRAPPSELVAELRRRYEAIGGRSPLNTIHAEVARKLGVRLATEVNWANRLWRPYVADRLTELARRGVRRVALVPLAQHSAHVYEADARRSAEPAGIALTCARNWGRTPALIEAFGRRIAAVLDGQERDADAQTTVVLTAHSLPRAVVDAGDPYEREFRASAEAVIAFVREQRKRPTEFVVAFQSQGMAGPGAPAVAWLGPDVKATLDDIAQARGGRVVFAPVGFLADHVEILYDLDVEARALAVARGLEFARVPSLNADDDFIDVLVDVARPLLVEAEPRPTGP